MSNSDAIVANVETLAGASKTVINIKQADGGYKVVKPVTTTDAIIGLDGKVLDAKLTEIDKNFSTNNDSISTLKKDTTNLSNDMRSLVDYVDPFMDDLKSHIEIIDSGSDTENDIFEHVYNEIDGLKLYIDKHAEVVDTDNPIENNIFEHVYQEMDTLIDKYNQMSNKITNILSSIETINSSIKTINANIESLTTKINNIDSELDSHQDTII